MCKYKRKDEHKFLLDLTRKCLARTKKSPFKQPARLAKLLPLIEEYISSVDCREIEELIVIQSDHNYFLSRSKLGTLITAHKEV